MRDYPKNVPAEVIRWLKRQKRFVTSDELAAGMGTTKRTASCYLSRLAKCGSLTRIAKGKYISGSMYLGREVGKIAKLIQRKMPLTPFVIWSTEIISPVSHHMLGKHIIFIEADEYAVGNIKDVLLEEGSASLLDPTAKELEDIFSSPIDVILFKKSEKYATIRVSGVLTASLEKALIDLYFLSTRRKFPIPPSELIDAVKNALRDGLIDLKVFSRYAARRNVKNELARELKRSR